MKFRILLTSAALTIATAVSAQASCAAHQEQVMSCAEGSAWDAETKTCVPQTSS